MLFSSNIFLFFFLPAVLFIYYVFFGKSRAFQNAFLFFSSLFFYAWGEPKFVLVMAGSIVMNWLIGYMIGRDEKRATRAKTALAIGVAANLLVIFVFKYLMFTMGNINLLFGIDLSIPVIELPIGISFFTFQSMSYLVDVYRNDGRMQRNLINVGLYIAFFPQLIAGPIVRYNSIDEQIGTRQESVQLFSEGVERFIIGLAKKVIIANTMATVADFAFDNPEGLSALLAWLGAAAYTMQIYFDFSGYSDMAIGLGRMFGFELEENFNYPYISKSITEFWRRWHMSLGTWFRDYLYIPLGGNRTKSKARHIFNIFVVWLCTGIWHGANWTFIGWGLMYFVLLIFEKNTGYDVADKEGRHHLIKHIYTMLFVIFGWVLFRAESISAAAEYMKAMAGMGCPLINDGFLEYFRQSAVYLIMAIIGSTPLVSRILKKRDANTGAGKVLTVVTALYLIGIFIVSVSFIVKDTYNPFIYFNF
ncbi:MAG: MBOAT family protein [Mogibacterium sp.]|nr:MBOAT family protein [Mogibacterium sp.]